MEKYTNADLEEALKSITSTLSKCEKAFVKLKQGTPQYTLLQRRIKAFEVSIELIKRELSVQ